MGGFIADNVLVVDNEESESDQEVDRKILTEPVKGIYESGAILSKLKDIAWPDNVDWIHKLTVVHDQPEKVNVNDDLVRESEFLMQASEGVREAFQTLEKQGIPFLRPPDYYAEMVKSDAQMLKIKGKILAQTKKMTEAEERKKAREAKKIAKEVQAQRIKEKTKRKKEEIESVKKWRKQRQKSGFSKGDDDMELPFNENMGFERSKKRQGVAPGDRSGGRKAGRKGHQDKNAKNREHRNSKFGFGGRKGMKKQNTADTTDDLRGFNKGGLSGNKRKRY